MGSHGGRGVEHSVIEAYKWPNFLRPIYKQAKKGNTNKDPGRGVLRNHAIQKGKFEKTIPHHGMEGWMEEMALKPKSSIATDQSMALSNLALKKEKSMRLLN